MKAPREVLAYAPPMQRVSEMAIAAMRARIEATAWAMQARLDRKAAGVVAKFGAFEATHGPRKAKANDNR